MPEIESTSPASSAATSNRSTSPASVKGVHTPFPAGDLPEGVDEETRLFHGIDPETKERVSVTLEGLKAEFGDVLGEKKYMDIAGIAGGSVFFNAKAEATSYRPALGIAGVTKPEHQKQIAEILAAKD